MYPISKNAIRQKSKPYVLANARTNEELNFQVGMWSSRAMRSGLVYSLHCLLYSMDPSVFLNTKIENSYLVSFPSVSHF